MNIEEAKEEIKRTVKAYHQKDASGCYKIPVESEKPLSWSRWQRNWESI